MDSNARFKKLLAILVLFLVSSQATAQSDTDIARLIESLKKDERGPYQAIRWFCPDGSVLLPNERCPQPGGIQHALPKDIVQKLANEKGIYLGQILAGTPYQAFWDSEHGNSRAIQYQLERYLATIDDGWIFRRARYYRGAFQAEDEEAWGDNFLKWLLSKDEVLTSQFLLARQLNQDLPHAWGDNRWASIRALAKTIADSLPSFLNLRIKIHGQPDVSDLQDVKDFRQKNSGRIPKRIAQMLAKLESEMEIAYRPTDLKSLLPFVAKLPPNSPVSTGLRSLVAGDQQAGDQDQNATVQRYRAMADLLWTIRRAIPGLPLPEQRLNLMDLSVELETILFRESNNWKPQILSDLLEKNFILAKAAAGCGFLEVWEWQSLERQLLQPIGNGKPTIEALSLRANTARQAVEWTTSMIHAIYEPVISRFTAFEPLATSFIDEHVRASILLPMGETAAHLQELVALKLGGSNSLMGNTRTSNVRGLNPGYALGELVVIRDPAEPVTYSASKIYVLPYAPADIKPVAGIATVSEGNPVSHVQLLARNLGIPNAVLSGKNLMELVPHNGQLVFYAVSPRGSVLMKAAAEMNEQERALFQERKKPVEKIRVPTNHIDLQQTKLINLREIRARDSGRLCGPKAANLGQLKSMYPDLVVEGIVVPFGIFRRHFDQQMPRTSASYWQYLRDTFLLLNVSQKSEREIEEHILARLTILRRAIKTMPLLPSFQQELRQGFLEIFGSGLGETPVFIRSDTNMEDLKDFTGAGLNLTVFNMVDETRILQAILDVWASPFTERSYRWRQKYLLNPENVYPSILLLPTVNVDKSGVMITTGVSSGDSRDITVAFNRGAGGAVEGQKAESYLLKADGNFILLSPSREATYTILPRTGGTARGSSTFNEPILNRMELQKLRQIADDIRSRLPDTPGISSAGPFDVELGFLGERLILFQARPFVENKNAQASLFLRSLDPRLPQSATVSLDEKLNVLAN